jgi:hypothetical protein
MSQPLIDLALQDMYWADQGSNLLTNPGFETGGNPPTGWTQLNAIDTTETGASPASTGTKIGQIAYDGSHALGYMYQGIGLPDGRRVHATGWGRTDGVSSCSFAFDSAVAACAPITTTTWTARESIGVLSGGNFFYLMVSSLAAARYAQWDDVSVYEQFMYTRNRGSLGGKVQVGDGRTSTTYPTMLNLNKATQKGMSFDGGDHLLWTPIIPNDTYTMVALVTEDVVGDYFLIDARASGGTGWVQFGSGSLAASSGTLYVDDIPSISLTSGQLHCIACAGITLFAPGGLSIMCSYTFFLKWVGKLYGFRLFPGTLTPRQLRDVRQRMLAEVWK